MRKAIIAFMVGSMLMGTASASTKMTWTQRQNKVRFQTLENPYWTRHENELTIRASARTFRVSAGTMMCIAERESGLVETAYNSSSGASGLFQHLRAYWNGRVAAYNRAMGNREWLKVGYGVFQSRANALVAAWMIKTGGLSPWGGSCG